MEQTVDNTKAINLFTSVLTNIDYRYGNDQVLINSDPEVTNFQCNTVNPTIIPNDNNNLIIDHYISTNSFISPIWSSSAGLSSVSGAGASSVIVASKGNNFTYVKANGVALTGIPFGGATPSLNYIFALVYVDGTIGTVINYDGSPLISASLTGFTCDVAYIDYPAGLNKLYLVYIDYNLGSFNVIDFYTRIGVGRTTAFTLVIPSTALQLLDVAVSFGLVEMVSYFNCNNINNILNYFYTNYGGKWPLPLTFPANAVSTTN